MAIGLTRVLAEIAVQFSAFFDDALADRRKREAEHPELTRFDETLLPPRDFVIVQGEPPSEAESAWTRASMAILGRFVAAELAAFEGRSAGDA
jgi:hypothetical protein